MRQEDRGILASEWIMIGMVIIEEKSSETALLAMKTKSEPPARDLRPWIRSPWSDPWRSDGTPWIHQIYGSDGSMDP